MIGTLVNFATVAAGSFLGAVLKNRIPSRLSGTVIQGIGLFTLYLGVSMSLSAKNGILVLFSILIGGLIGEALDIEGALDSLGRRLEKRFGSGNGDFTRGFVTASLLFCVGPMTIVGSIQDGLVGDYQILLTKGIMDGFCSVALASTLGIGVGFSALVVLIYQGALTLFASWARGFLTDPVVSLMTATGGLMIIGIGINLLEIKKLRVGNLLPALAVAVVLGLVAVK